MKIELEFTAQIKRALGRGKAALEAPDGASLSDVVDLIARRYADQTGGVLFLDDSRINPSVAIFVNDVQIRTAESCTLTDGDRVTFLSPISGG